MNNLKFHADVEDLTVYSSNGVELWDLNTGGEPISNTGELMGFVDTLCNQGAFDNATRDELIASIEADRHSPNPSRAESVLID